ncbi:MAG: DNA translocase FtsK [Candidatus Taylorbacteria bacterium]|nr:DNA translocase FtsK [Candidatus Taylorbacteria bacterium]
MYMAKREKKKSPDTDIKQSSKTSYLKESTWKSVWGISLFILSIFFLFAGFGGGGLVGTKVHDILSDLLGYGYYLIPAILLILSLSFFGDQERSFPPSKIAGTVLFIVSGLGLFELTSETSGGIVGALISKPLLQLFDYATSVITLVGLLLISIIVIYDAALRKEHVMFWRLIHGKKDEEGMDEKVSNNKDKIKGQPMSDIKDMDEEEIDEKKAASVLETIKAKLKAETKPEPIEKEPKVAVDNKAENDKDDVIQVSRKSLLLGKAFVPPPLSLLEGDSGKPGVGDIKANANVIKRTLQNFGIDVEMDEVSIGPSVTRYALKPAEGVKLSKILGLQNNLSLALAAHPIRIEAPIPGKSLVGIEIPNTVKTKVGLGTLLAQDEYQKSETPLMIALGKGISGKSYFGNLTKLPHLLIAGTTGSGKSITIHAIITSLLYRNSADNLRFIMIDPKRVELTQYNKIPHLLTPVITDAKKAILSLKWAAKEMDRRYNILEKHSVRDISSYHKNILTPLLEKKKKGEIKDDEMIDPMPYIVIVIDELADIMQTYPRELEAGIVRLAQMSRAVGIHLILSTQRPSVNVITGLIKANVPSRIALQVASQIDSRTILDMRGAEELLGAGDMLYLSGDMATPQRIQSAFISEAEMKRVVQYLIDNAEGLPSEITLTGESVTNVTPDPIFSSSTEGGLGDDEDVDDDLYEEAKQIVLEAGKASTSYIQRKLRVGYARAARLMDILEDKGVIGPADGAKPREVLIGREGGSSNDEEYSEEAEEEETNL